MRKGFGRRWSYRAESSSTSWSGRWSWTFMRSSQDQRCGRCWRGTSWSSWGSPSPGVHRFPYPLSSFWSPLKISRIPFQWIWIFEADLDIYWFAIWEFCLFDWTIFLKGQLNLIFFIFVFSKDWSESLQILFWDYWHASQADSRYVWVHTQKSVQKMCQSCQDDPFIASIPSPQDCYAGWRTW